MATEVSGQVFGPQGSREGGLSLTLVCSRTKKASDREPEFPAYTHLSACTGSKDKSHYQAEGWEGTLEAGWGQGALKKFL